MSTLFFVIVLDFGYMDNPAIHSTIYDLGDRVLAQEAQAKGSVILAQSETYKYLRSQCRQLVETNRLIEIDVGQSGAENGGGIQGGGTYHVLKRAKELIAQRIKATSDWMSPKVFIVAHQLHIRRALKQAELLGIDAIPAGYLPQKLYPEAAQWWCRNKILWRLREGIGYIPLKIAGQL